MNRAAILLERRRRAIRNSLPRPAPKRRVWRPRQMMHAVMSWLRHLIYRTEDWIADHLIDFEPRPAPLSPAPEEKQPPHVDFHVVGIASHLSPEQEDVLRMDNIFQRWSRDHLTEIKQ